jgi:hypothetical protein
MKFQFPYTERQLVMVEHRAQILWIGAGTKTGKSAGLFCWLIQGLLHGQACAFVGPWFFRSRRAFDEIRNLLAPWIAARQVKVNEARLQLTAVGGGYLDFSSADNPHGTFGANYDRIVLDEASRMPAEIYAAALTTISATNGKLRAAFNVELGQRNWAIANLLRVQRMAPEERAKTGEDFLTFPTGGDGLVSPALIELMKSQMPLPLWEALYLGKIPTSDCSLFRNLNRIFTGQELEVPLPGTQYFLAADVARKKDWSVLTVVDNHGRVVATDRFHQISWSLQVERAALWYRTFRCSKAIVDATGVGDVVAEEFEKAGMVVEPFVFTAPSRRQLVEELVVACDNCEIVLPSTERFMVYRQELESMEFVLDGSSIKYEVPSGSHDDALFSLALATHLYRKSRGLVLGLLDMLKRRAKEIAEGIRDRFGELIHKPAPKPVMAVTRPKPPEETRFEGYARLREKPEFCPICQTKNKGQHPDGHFKTLCRQCGAVDDVLPLNPADPNLCPEEGCGLKLTLTGGIRYCQNHGQAPSARPAVVGMTFAQYKSRDHRGFGRFGRFG